VRREEGKLHAQAAGSVEAASEGATGRGSASASTGRSPSGRLREVVLGVVFAQESEELEDSRMAS